MWTKLTKTFGFEAAHWLPTFPDGHKCRRMHGHSYRVDLELEGEVDEERGYLLDFGEVQAAIAPLHSRLDHYVLNDVEGLENPTAEYIARWIWERLKPTLPMLRAVRVRETCTNASEYRGEE